jgi:hypothetical protein
MTLSGGDHGTTATREDSGVATKSFEISKRLVWEAWKRVAANQGGPGVDRQSIDLFRNRLARNLYALWNRMSSGSYFPQPVKEVLIPKGDGFRPLGVPTITDRVAQMAVKLLVEPKIDAIFHSSSFGYRLLFRPAVTDHIVGIPFKRHLRMFSLDPSIKRIVEKEVSQQRTNHPALRSASIPSNQLSGLLLHRTL